MITHGRIGPKGPKVPFFVMKGALFVQNKVTANSNLTSKKCPFSVLNIVRFAQQVDVLDFPKLC